MTRQHTSSLIRAGNFFFGYRDILFPAVFISLAVLSQPHLLGGSYRSDLMMDLLGISVILTGQVIRAIVIGYVYIERGGKNKQVHASKLVQGGIFTHCRNPLYVGNMLVYTGLILIFNSFWMYAIGLPFFLFAYLSIVTAEENFLRNTFGEEYNNYCNRVPRFLPSLRGITKTLSHMEYNAKRMIRKDYGSIFYGIAGALAIMIWERRANLNQTDPHNQIGNLVTLLILATLAYSLARFLKKTGRLASSEEPIYKRQDTDTFKSAA